MSKKFLQAAGIVAALGVAALPLANTFAVDAKNGTNSYQGNDAYYYTGTDTVSVTINVACGVFDYEANAENSESGAGLLNGQQWTDKEFSRTVTLGSLNYFNFAANADTTTGTAASTLEQMRVIICNNAAGAEILAQGGEYVSDDHDADGVTNMTPTNNNNEQVIATGTNTSGDTSSWSFKVTLPTGDDATSVSADEDYVDWAEITDEKSVIATTEGVTGQADGQWAPSYRVYVGNKQQADTYTGHVTYFAELPVADNNGGDNNGGED